MDTPKLSLENQIFSLVTPRVYWRPKGFCWRPTVYFETLNFSLETPYFVEDPKIFIGVYYSLSWKTPDFCFGDPKKFIEDPQHYKGGSYLGSLINFLGSLTKIWGLQYMWISNEKFRVSNLGVKIFCGLQKKIWGLQ